jgi:cobalt-zinc-cadmium efflux system protein
MSDEDRRKSDSADSHSHSHAHSHGHSHGHSDAGPCSEKNTRTLWLVLLLSASYMVAEIAGGIWTGSLALLADSAHMAIDTGAVALGLFASWIGRRPATEAKTYGYYRVEILAALINGCVLIGAAVWILIEAIPRFSQPPEVKGYGMAWIAAGGLVVNLISLRLMHGSDRHHLNLRGVWLHLMGDTLGSLGAVAAAILIWKFGWYLADPILSVALTALIVFGAGKLLVDCVNVLLEGVPKHVDLAGVKRDLESADGVKNVHDLHVWLVTSGLTALSAHVTVKDGSNHSDVLRVLTALLHERHGIEHVTLQLEATTFAHRELHV